MSDQDEGCTCTGSPVAGTLPAMDTPEGIQRCDECQVFPGDLEAAQALADMVGGVVRFVKYVSDDDEEDVTFTGDLPDDVLIANSTNPWVEVGGEPVDWMART